MRTRHLHRRMAAVWDGMGDVSKAGVGPGRVYPGRRRSRSGRRHWRCRSRGGSSSDGRHTRWQRDDRGRRGRSASGARGGKLRGSGASGASVGNHGGPQSVALSRSFRVAVAFCSVVVVSCVVGAGLLSLVPEGPPFC